VTQACASFDVTEPFETHPNLFGRWRIVPQKRAFVKVKWAKEAVLACLLSIKKYLEIRYLRVWGLGGKQGPLCI
jgi:hypothetical protein